LRSLHLINREDRDRVRRFILLNEARLAREEEALALMSARLERGHLVEAGDFPVNVVTLHSQVRMKLWRQSCEFSVLRIFCQKAKGPSSVRA
jgi:hypothetical protein